MRLTRKVPSTYLHDLQEFFGDKFGVRRWNRFGEFAHLHPVDSHGFAAPLSGEKYANWLTARGLVFGVVALFLGNVAHLGTVNSKRPTRVLARERNGYTAVRLKVPMAPQLETVRLKVEHAPAEHDRLFERCSENVFD